MMNIRNWEASDRKLWQQIVEQAKNPFRIVVPQKEEEEEEYFKEKSTHHLKRGKGENTPLLSLFLFY